MAEKLAFKFDLIEIHLNFTWYVALVATVLQAACRIIQSIN